MIFKSIRWRLQLWHSLILVLVLTTLGLTAYQVARENLLRQVDRNLQRELMSLARPERPERLERPPWANPGPGAPANPQPMRERRRGSDMAPRIQEAIESADLIEGTNTVYYVLWEADGTVTARSTSAPAEIPFPDRLGRFSDEPPGGPPGPPDRPGPPEVPDARTRGAYREMYRWLPRGGCVLVGHYLGPEKAAMRQLALWLGMAGSGVLLLGLAGGWWMASRAMRPIRDISNTAVKIAAGDLSQRVSAADAESELGRLATVLNSTFARLEAAFDHQARFTADASHELRTPVSVILSQTQSALHRERSAPEYIEALQACQRAAQRMRTLTESLLQLARLDAGEEPIKHEPLDLARVVREALEMVRPLAQERQVEIQTNLPELTCPGDAERLGQVVVNLLTNAIQFNRSPGKVHIALSSQNGSAFLTVSDTGEGISPADLPHIFERFYRVDKSRSRGQGRTGLGLAICKAIVDAHGGSIEAASEPGAGSVFTVKLPLH